MTTTGANLARLFVFGQVIDQIVMMEAPDHADVDSDSNTTEIQRFHYHTQLIGTVTHVTASSQATVESYTYDPYGTPTIKDKNGTTVTASAIRNPYLFTARQLDEETGLYFYRARHYSPVLKRFIQRDPLEYVDGPNASAYVRCSPACGVDPTGCNQPPLLGTEGHSYVGDVPTWRKGGLIPKYSAPPEPVVRGTLAPPKTPNEWLEYWTSVLKANKAAMKRLDELINKCIAISNDYTRPKAERDAAFAEAFELEAQKLTYETERT